MSLELAIHESDVSHADKSNLRLSIIIPNYNYGRFVGAAIESALAVDWPDVEVIVVDDGSTDESHDVIRTFDRRIVSMFQENAGQRVACNVGFARSTGDAIIFLDSDDMLDPSIGHEMAKAWAPGVSKVQFQMRRVDAEGQSLNSVFPAYRPLPTPEKVRDWVSRALACPTAPGSGNVYARWFLNFLFPLDDSCGAFSDSACLATAPLFGDVMTVAKPVVAYRVHGENDSRSGDDSRFAREIARAKARFDFARKFQQIGAEMRDEMFLNSIEVLQFRVASMTLRPDLHPITYDSRVRALGDAVRLFFISSSSRLKLRLAVLCWSFAALLGPPGLARLLVARRYR